MLTPLYQEGETVRIKDYDEIYKSYAVDGRVRIYPAWVSDMKQFCGKEVVVTEVCKDAGRTEPFVFTTWKAILLPSIRVSLTLKQTTLIISCGMTSRANVTLYTFQPSTSSSTRIDER